MPFYSWPTYLNLSIAVFTIFFTLGISWYIWDHRYIPAASHFLTLTLLIAVWAVFYFIEVVSNGVERKVFWENCQFSLQALIPIMYLAFIRIYIGKRKPMRWIVYLLLSIDPILNFILIWTNLLPGAFRINAATFTQGLPYPGILVSHYGWWYWFNMLYIFAFLLGNLVILVQAYFRSPLWNRNRYWYLIIGLFIPWLSSALSVPGWGLDKHDYLMILSVAFSMLIIAWGIFRQRILDILPIAREAVLDQMYDAVAVVDLEGRMVELNQSAKNYGIHNSDFAIGKSIQNLLPVDIYKKLFDPENLTAQENEISMSLGSEILDFDLRVSPLQDDVHQNAGWLATFHDITQKKIEEAKLVSAEASAKFALKESQQRNFEITVLGQITEELNLATSLRMALLPTLETIQSISLSPQIWICLLEPEENRHREIFYNVNNLQSPLTYFENRENIPECIQRLINSGETKMKRYEKEACTDFAGNIPYAAFYSLPLYSRNKPLGVLNITINENHPVEEASIRLIEMIGASLSTAIERVQLIKNEYEQRRQAEAFREINSALTASLNINDVLDLLLKLVSRLVPMDSGSVMLVEGENAHIVRQIGYEYLGKEINDQIAHLNFDLKNTKNLFHVVDSRKAVIINDIPHDPEWTPVITIQDFKSWIGAPVLIDNQVQMIFSLDKRKENFFRQKHAELLTTFCTEAALAIQNAHLFEAGQKRIGELVGLHATMQNISSQLDVQPLLQDIMERALTLLKSSSGVLGLYEEDKKIYRIAVTIRGGKGLAGNIVTSEQGLMGQVGKARKPITVDDYSVFPNLLPKYLKAFPHAVLEVPMLAGEQLIGVIAVGAKDPQRKYNEEDIRLLSLFAQQATIALTNARLFSEAKQKAEEAETLRQASSIVASTLKQGQALQLILAQMAKVVPYDAASILLSRGDELELVEGNGSEHLPTPIGMRIRLDANQPGPEVCREKKTIIVSDMRQEYPEFFTINQTDIRSWLGVPLVYKNRTLGVLSLDSLQEDHFNKNHARMISAFADQVSISLENVRMYENAVKSAQRFATLYNLSQKISLNLQPKDLYQAIHHAASELMSAEAFILSLYDAKNEMIDDVYFIDHDVQQKNSQRPYGKGLFSQVIRENRSLVFNSFDKEQLAATQAIISGAEKDETLVKSALIVPLRSGHQIKGILSVQSYQPNAYQEEDKETLEMLATQATVALENTRLFNEIQGMAMTDALTGIYNRRKFFELAENEFERARRYEHPLSAIMMDIDLFKNVNDTYGHAVGDIVLKEIAQICQHKLRKIDILARYGGEEFVALLPETNSQKAGILAERLRSAIADTPIQAGENEVHVTLSFGVVEQDENCRTIEELLDHSDQALYASKHNGRNRVTAWTGCSAKEAQ